MKRPRLALALAFGVWTAGCELEASGLDAGAGCRPEPVPGVLAGDVNEPTSCQEVCNAAGRLCDDEATPPCYVQQGGALLQYEGTEFVQGCAARIAPTLESPEGRLSLSAITCFCR